MCVRGTRHNSSSRLLLSDPTASGSVVHIKPYQPNKEQGYIMPTETAEETASRSQMWKHEDAVAWLTEEGLINAKSSQAEVVAAFAANRNRYRRTERYQNLENPNTAAREAAKAAKAQEREAKAAERAAAKEAKAKEKAAAAEAKAAETAAAKAAKAEPTKAPAKAAKATKATKATKASAADNPFA